MPQISRSRGQVAFAERISAGGTGAAVAIFLITALVAGVSVLHGVRQVASPRPARAAPVILRTSARPTPARRVVIGAPVAQLTRAVRHMMSTNEGAAASRDYGTAATGRPVIELTRASRNRTWAFGTAVIPVPAGSAAPPWTAFFLAHASGGRWRIALSGTAGFGQLLTSASAAVLTVAEKQLLVRFNAAQAAPASTGSGTPAGGAAPASPPPSSPPPGGTLPGGTPPAGTPPASPPPSSPAPTSSPPPAGAPSSAASPPALGAAGLALPWRAGQTWRFVAAFSGAATGDSATMFAFSGGDGRVLAAGPGRLFRFCGKRGSDALIEVIHPDGSATEYYQLSAETRIPDGSAVTAGMYLGRTGTSLACGAKVSGTGPGVGPGPGKSTGKKTTAAPGAVSFAVIRTGGVVSLNGLTLGGWTFHQQPQAPFVWAQRAAARVTLGGQLTNFGPSTSGAASPGPTPAPSPTQSAPPSPPVTPGGGKASASAAALGLPVMPLPGVALSAAALPAVVATEPLGGA